MNLNISQRLENKGKSLTLFHEFRITLTPKPDKDHTENKITE